MSGLLTLNLLLFILSGKVYLQYLDEKFVDKIYISQELA